MQLNQGQRQALDTLIAAVIDRNQKLITLSGPAGSGKTTILKQLIKELKDLAVLMPEYLTTWHFTATTNKAVAALADAMGPTVLVTTIHSLLGLVPYQGMKLHTKLKQRRDSTVQHNSIIVIDEASYIGEELAVFIARVIDKVSLIIFVGDSYQLPPVKDEISDIFDPMIIPQIELTQVMRQADGNPIQELSLDLRDVVKHRAEPNITLDDVNISWLNSDDFIKAFCNDCIISAPGAVRALAWTNHTAQHYNEQAALACNGRTEFHAGDIVVNNHYFKSSQQSIPTDATVQIHSTSPWYTERGKTMRSITTSYGELTELHRDHNATAEQRLYYYPDLRYTYASTINKAQGSTYDIVYVDLNDLAKCSNRDLQLRLLYVAVSRARHKVVFTGDI